MDTKEKQLLKKINSCKTKKCSKLIKKKKNMEKNFEKAQDKACPQKNDMAFYRCSTKFFEGSNMEKAMNNIRNCGDKKCVKVKKNLKTYRNKIYLDGFKKNVLGLKTNSNFK